MFTSPVFMAYFVYFSLFYLFFQLWINIKVHFPAICRSSSQMSWHLTFAASHGPGLSVPVAKL